MLKETEYYDVLGVATDAEVKNSTPPPSPAAQRNLKNQWSKLNSLCQDWRSASRRRSRQLLPLPQVHGWNGLWGTGSHANKPLSKLLNQQELYRGKLLSSYRDMVSVVTHMVSSCKSMRCYFRGTSGSSLAQFSLSSEDNNDSGDCGGIPVFTFSSISYFEELAWEIVQMFISELGVKRLLVVELLSIYDEKVAEVHWSDELYDGEFNELLTLNLYSEEICQPVLPSLRSSKSSTSILQSKPHQDSDILQIYLTTWMVEVNVDRYRMDEIFNGVGGEMHVDFLIKIG